MANGSSAMSGFLEGMKESTVERNWSSIRFQFDELKYLALAMREQFRSDPDVIRIMVKAGCLSVSKENLFAQINTYCEAMRTFVIYAGNKLSSVDSPVHSGSLKIALVLDNLRESLDGNSSIESLLVDVLFPALGKNLKPKDSE